MWLLGALFLVVGLGFSLFMDSLYARLETGNRFIDLSIDMFCIAGLDGFFEFESAFHHKPESLRVRHSPKSLASTPGQEALDKLEQTSPI